MHWHQTAQQCGPPTETRGLQSLQMPVHAGVAATAHGQNLQCQVSYKNDFEVQKVGRNSHNHFLQLPIHSPEQCLMSTCVCPLKVSLAPAPRTAWGCPRWCRFSGTPPQIITVETQRCSSFEQNSIQTVLETALWQLLWLFTSEEKNLCECTSQIWDVSRKSEDHNMTNEI